MKMNRILGLLSAAALALSGCVREDMVDIPREEAEGMVTFDVAFSIPTDKDPETRVMDVTPVIQNIYIAVFGSNNYLNEFVRAIPLKNGRMNVDLQDGHYIYEKENGVYNVRFSLQKTSSRRHVHVLANVPEGANPPDFGYVDEVLGKNIYTSGDQDGYWQYLEFADGIEGSPADVARFNGLKLVRNFAGVQVEATAASGFTVEGFELYNTPTRGSFLPYTGKDVVDGSLEYHFYTGWIGTGGAQDYETVHDQYPGYLIPGATPLYHPSFTESDFPSDTGEKFIYEHPASPENPTYIIAKLTKAGDTKFYRLDILDNAGVRTSLLRNYHYTIRISAINTPGYSTVAEAEDNPSDYNFTLSTDTQEASNIANHGALMEVGYVEKVFAKAETGVEFKYRYTPDLNAVPRVYEAGALSALEGDGEIDPDWSEGDAGTPGSDGWYTVTYDVEGPNNLGSDEVISTFSVSGGVGSKMIRRDVRIITMRPKDLTVTTWELESSTNTLTLAFTIPEGLRRSMFPIQFKFKTMDDISGAQVLSPQDGGLVSESVPSSTGSTIYFLKDYTYSEYEAEGGRTVVIHFKSPSAIKPVINLEDRDGYFVPLDLGKDFATGLSAAPLPMGTGYQTTLEFVSTVANVPITLNLTNLKVPGNEGNTYTFTPSATGTQQIVLEATHATQPGQVSLSCPSYNSPPVLTVNRYTQYVSGSLTQSAPLPLGLNQSTTFSFNYSARHLMPVTITATGLDIYAADGSGAKLNDANGQYTFTPSAQGEQTFTVKSQSRMDAGTISLSVPLMSDPDPLTVTRATTFTLPANSLILTGANDFATPLYWRANKTNNTRNNVVGNSSYFNVDSSTNTGNNTGNVTIDISSFTRAEGTRVYFLYTYTYWDSFLFVIPTLVTAYMFADATLGDLIDAATGGSPATLAFSRNN